MQVGGSCSVTPKHEVPFLQLTSTLLSGCTLSCNVSLDSDTLSAESPISPMGGYMLLTRVPPCSREGSVDPLPARAEITRPEGVSVSCPDGDPACASEYHGSPLLSIGCNVFCCPSSKCPNVVWLSHHPKSQSQVDPAEQALKYWNAKRPHGRITVKNEWAEMGEWERKVMVGTMVHRCRTRCGRHFFYATMLVPSYWKTINESQWVSQYHSL